MCHFCSSNKLAAHACASRKLTRTRTSVQVYTANTAISIETCRPSAKAAGPIRNAKAIRVFGTLLRPLELTKLLGGLTLQFLSFRDESFIQHMKGRDHLGDLGLNGRIILKFILKELDVRIWIDFIWIRIELIGWLM